MKTPSVNSSILKLEVLNGTATRTSVNAVESRTTSLESDVATAQGEISTLQGDVATLTQEIVDARNAGHAALSNVLPSTASQNHLTDDELEFFGTLPSTISDLMSNVEEVDADFVSISYNPSGAGASRGLYSGIMSETVPSQSSTGLTSWVNQGAATVADVLLGLQVHHPSTATAGNICGLVCAAPTAPYELTALLELSSGSGQYPSALLGWADSASTKTHMVALCGDGRSGLIYAANYASWGFSTSNAPMFTREARRVWLRFADTGDSISVHWSHSGASWIQLYSSAKSSGYLGANGYNQLFFGVSNWGSPAVATLLSWSIS